MARRFNRIAWPAFAVPRPTGVWNVVEVDVADTSIEYQITLFLKLVVVAASASAPPPTSAPGARARSPSGAPSAARSAIAAVFLGILLTVG